jgi:hypothetical protein
VLLTEWFVDVEALNRLMEDPVRELNQIDNKINRIANAWQEWESDRLDSSAL